ncbi:MAG TPA: hypothetical protein VHV76_15620 [Mycobacteriales bacterium]|nr:hypothetical protein [Mycobacteriales bacterium]
MTGESHLPTGGARGATHRQTAVARATVAALLVVLCVGGTLVADQGTAHAGAAGSVRDAYWWQPEPVTGLIPAPGVPAGGLYVASSPSGTQALSALSITTPIRSGFVRLLLQVAQRQVINPPDIEAYPATSSWQSGGPQPWSSRPRYDGSAPLGHGVYDAAQTRMSLIVPAAALAKGIELLPAPTPGTTLEPTFAISFRSPLVTAVSLPSRPTPTASDSSQSTPSNSASPAHQPGSTTPTPTHSPHRHHRPSPTARPHHTAIPGTPRPPPATATPAVSLPARSADHFTRNVVIALAIVTVLIAAVGTSIAWRRRRSIRQDPQGGRRT